MAHGVELTVSTPPVGCGPVTTGLPWPRGELQTVEKLVLLDATGVPVLLQATPLDRWPDGSIRWVRLDWIAEAGRGPYRVTLGEPVAVAGPRVATQVTKDGVTVDTGCAHFVFHQTDEVFPLRSLAVEGVSVPVTSTFTIRDQHNRPVPLPRLASEKPECGPVMARMRRWVPVVGRKQRLTLHLDLTFYAGAAVVRFDLTLGNPRRAMHPGGLWDLGDPGSSWLKDVAISFQVQNSSGFALCSPELAAPVEQFPLPLELYQDSSGGENWHSTNHINHRREIPLRFRGYRLRSGPDQRGGLRATPMVLLGRGEQAIGLAMPEFWQNFPIAIEATSTALVLRLLPHQFADVHELQGGEQKTWTFALGFGSQATAEVLEWFRRPARAFASPPWYCRSGAIPYLTPQTEDPHSDYLALVAAALEGPNSFAAKREVIDEYGWRHFGDIYGDHEAVYHHGPPPLVSHYNNQYDAIAGFGYQFLRSGDRRWFQLMDELARHVIDIDIYHTTADKSAYNGGLFWHTYHYADADTSTHRSYPRSLLQMKHRAGLDPHDPKVQKANRVYAPGGGPSNEHNYTTGLMLHYFLTGHLASRDAVLGLARWVINMDDGRQTIFRWLSRADTGLASQSRDPSYHGPGRGAGNSLVALLDGYRLSGERVFLAKAEQLIRRCIHPNDDMAQRNLLDVENRWFYTMFLQALGKYLDYKDEYSEHDAMYAYARASLLHYARWMAQYEVPTLSRPEILEYPNETWAAQDLRKCDVFLFAAKHTSGPEKLRFRERAEFFFRDAIARLQSFPTRTLARPLVLLLSHGWMIAYFRQHPDVSAPPPVVARCDFGTPTVFVPQKQIAKKRAKMLVAVVTGGVLVVLLALISGILG
ncbi:MAG: hypothetical protein RMJ56_12380 [Gemmataceae bacterium]|nr:hypothetical protein [Gemmata sp.]MDW8198390.1 hypothetical protein [Gemmataceae bacterium]